MSSLSSTRPNQRTSFNPARHNRCPLIASSLGAKRRKLHALPHQDNVALVRVIRVRTDGQPRPPRVIAEHDGPWCVRLPPEVEAAPKHALAHADNLANRGRNALTCRDPLSR